jgi:hypothetical protein
MLSVHLLKYFLNPSQLRAGRFVFDRLRVTLAAGSKHNVSLLAPVIHVFASSIDMMNINCFTPLTVLLYLTYSIRTPKHIPVLLNTPQPQLLLALIICQLALGG